MKVLIALICVAALAACNHNSTDAGKTDASAAGQTIPISNGDFEQTAAGGTIPGWNELQHAGEKSYEMRIESDGAFNGHGSFHMTRTHEQVYGSLSQDVNVSRFAGKTVELSAMLKSRDVGKKGWRLMLNGNAPGSLKYSPALTGTTDWQRQSVSLRLAPQVRTLTLGATLLDAGEGWLDDVELKVID